MDRGLPSIMAGMDFPLYVTSFANRCGFLSITGESPRFREWFYEGYEEDFMQEGGPAIFCGGFFLT